MDFNPDWDPLDTYDSATGMGTTCLNPDCKKINPVRFGKWCTASACKKVRSATLKGGAQAPSDCVALELMAAKLDSLMHQNEANRHRIDGFTRSIALALGVGADPPPSDASLVAMVCQCKTIAQSTASSVCAMQEQEKALRIKMADLKTVRNDSLTQIAVLKHEIAGLKEDLKYAKGMGFIRGSVPKCTTIRDNKTLSHFVMGRRSDVE